MRTWRRSIFTALLELGGPVFQKEERKTIRTDDCRIKNLYYRSLGRYNTINIQNIKNTEECTEFEMVLMQFISLNHLINSGA